MKRCDGLWLMTKTYAISCEASLRSDMAKRIMYSILPSVSDKTQLHMTGGVVDYNALRYAVEGRRDIIKYGTKACVQELKSYKKDINAPIPLQALSKGIASIESGDYSAAADLAAKCFADYSGWAGGYGGKAWEKIARSLQRLIAYDQTLKESKESKDLDQELQIMQQIVIELNVFDGLSHNNSSVMKNLVDQEWQEMHTGNNESRNKELDEITRMMDAKELTNPMDVYKEIESTLVESGDIHRFKDWTRKLHNLPEYRQTNLKKNEEMMRTRFRKIVNPYTARLNENADVLKSFYATIEAALPNITSGSLLPKGLIANLRVNLASIRGNVTQVVMLFQALKQKTPPHDERSSLIISILSNLSKVKDNLSQSIYNFENTWNDAADADHLADDRKIKLLNASKKMQETVQSAAYFLDSI